MKTSSFLTALRSHAALPLAFRADGETVSPGYHLTEVKRVAYETVDCGGVSHDWTETQFEVWVPENTANDSGRGHMPAEKFIRIIDRVETGLPLRGDSTARIHASFAGQPAALYDIASVEPRDGRLWVELVPDRTRCKAAERRLAAAGNVCCGASAEEQAEPAAAGCCGSTSGVAPAAACCA